MDHGRLNFEYWQNDEGKIVIRGNHHILTGHARKLVGNSVEGTACIYRLRHQRRLPDTSRACCGTNGYIEVVVICLGEDLIIRRGRVASTLSLTGIVIFLGYAVMQTNDNTAGLIFNGGDTGKFDLVQFACTVAKTAISIRLTTDTIGFVELTRNGITHAEACGVFNNKPGIEQAPEFQGTDQYQQ